MPSASASQAPQRGVAGTTMGSKQVLDEGKLADQLVEAGRTHAKEIAKRRAARYAADGVEHAPPAAVIEAAVLADAEVLHKRRVELRDAERALVAELGDDAAVFSARDVAAEAVRATLVEVRDSVQTNCGDVAVREAGYVGNTPRDAVALEEVGTTVFGNLTKKPPKATRRGVRFDAKAAVEGLDTQVTALATANADVLREKREEQAARQRRDAAWTAFEREFSSSKSRLDAELRAVGLDDLADRLVRSSRAAVTGAVEDGEDNSAEKNNGGGEPA